MVEMLAWCGAALSCLLSVPQATRVLRAERLDGISAATYVIVLGNAAVWAAWSICTGQYAAGIPALINGPAAILILRRLTIERRKSRNLDAVAAAGDPDSPLVAGNAGDRVGTSMRAPILIEIGLAQGRSRRRLIPWIDTHVCRVWRRTATACGGNISALVGSRRTIRMEDDHGLSTARHSNGGPLGSVSHDTERLLRRRSHQGRHVDRYGIDDAYGVP